MKFPKKLYPLIRSPKTHNRIEGGRGGGKTRNVADFIVMVMSMAPLWVLCGREIQKSLSDSVFAEMKQAIYRQNKGHLFDIVESRGVITCKTGAKAVFIGLQNHTIDSVKSFSGFHWAWIEEAQSVSRKSLDVLIPTLRTDGHFRITLGGKKYVFPLRMFIYTYNPYSWDDAIAMTLPDSRDDVQVIKINWADNPFFPQSLNEERLAAMATMSPDEYARIWEGIPFEDTERAVMSRSAIQAAMQRSLPAEGGVVLGVDVARFGDDRTVIYKRQGMCVTEKRVLTKQDTQVIADIAYSMAEGGRIMVDDTGVGGGVTDRLKRLGANVMPVNFGQKARDYNKYPDVISEMWFNLADLMPQISMPHDDELLQELSARHFKYTADERRKVESKDDYKKRTGRRSPDLADALILCFYSGRIQPAVIGSGHF